MISLLADTLLSNVANGLTKIEGMETLIGRAS